MAPRPVLAPYDVREGPRTLGTLWTLHREGEATACTINTHPFGWELRVLSGGKLHLRQVCHTEDEALAVSATWRDLAEAQGWH